MGIEVGRVKVSSLKVFWNKGGMASEKMIDLEEQKMKTL